MKRSLSLIVHVFLTILSPLLACFGCSSRSPSAPPSSPRIRWRGQETDYDNAAELESPRRPGPASASQSQKVQKP